MADSIVINSKISIDTRTGWSNTLSFDLGSDGENNLTDITNYTSQDASWFAASYWTRSAWAKLFKNVADVPIRLKSVGLRCCVGNSQSPTDPNKYMYFKSSAGSNFVAVGSGCKFQVNIAVVEDCNTTYSNYKLFKSDNHDMASIDKYNCSAHGHVAGRVNQTVNGTQFGRNDVYGDDNNLNDLSLDSQGNKRYRHIQKLEFKDDIVVPPGHYLYFTVRPISWHEPPEGIGAAYNEEEGRYYVRGYSEGGSSMGWFPAENVLIVVDDPEQFEAEIESVDENYIWRYVEESDGTKHWVKDRSAFMYMGESVGWAKLT